MALSIVCSKTVFWGFFYSLFAIVPVVCGGYCSMVVLFCSWFVCRMWIGISWSCYLPFGFPVASQANYFCELNIRF